MMIYFAPQRRDEVIHYTFTGEVITAVYKGLTDTFDLSGLDEGDEIVEIDTLLEMNPVYHAERIDGTLYVELVNFHGADASEAIRYPEWVEVSDG